MAAPRRSPLDRARHVPALAVAAAGLLPLALMVVGSLRRPGDPPSRAVELLPADPSVASYRDAVGLVDLLPALRNSLVVAALVVPLSVLCSSWAGFALTQVSRRAARLVVGLTVCVLVVPPTALVVGRFSLFRGLRLLDSYGPLVAPALYGTSSLAVLLYAWSFRRLPAAYLDAGRVAGLGPFRLWWQVALPLVRPMTMAVAVLAFVTTWGNFLDPLVYVQDPSLYTLPLALRSLQLLGPQDVPVQMAASAVATLPAVAAFLAVPRSVFSAVRDRHR